jgi:hypothetical protein
MSIEEIRIEALNLAIKYAHGRELLTPADVEKIAESFEKWLVRTAKKAGDK